MSTSTLATESAADQVTADHVRAAGRRIASYAHHTPVMTSRLFDQAAASQVFFKCENLQRGGAFKIRGAANLMLSLTAEERARGVVAMSSGNHAQAVAIMAKLLHIQATIVMPADAPASKLGATRAYGPEIVLFDRQLQNREELAREILVRTGAVWVPPYDHPAIVAGAGTAAMELLADTGEESLDAIVVPTGGGGLLSGTAVLARAEQPGIRIFGVEPETADDWRQSFASGQRVTLTTNPTIADGLRTPAPGQLPFQLARVHVEAILTVSEEEIRHAVRMLLSRLKLVVEPSGAAGAAAVLSGKLPAGLHRVGVILSGGNVDFEMLASICGPAAHQGDAHQGDPHQGVA